MSSPLKLDQAGIEDNRAEPHIKNDERKSLVEELIKTEVDKQKATVQQLVRSEVEKHKSVMEQLVKTEVEQFFKSQVDKKIEDAQHVKREADEGTEQKAVVMEQVKPEAVEEAVVPGLAQADGPLAAEVEYCSGNESVIIEHNRRLCSTITIDDSEEGMFSLSWVSVWD